MTDRVTYRVADYFDNAFSATPNAEEVDYDFSFQGHQTGPQTFVPALYVAMWMKAASLDKILSLAMMLQNPNVITQDDVNSLVARGVEELHKQRSADLAANPSVTVAGKQQKSAGGILLP